MKSFIASIICSVSLLSQQSLALSELDDSYQLEHVVLNHSDCDAHTPLNQTDFDCVYTQQVSAVAEEAKQIVDEALSEFDNSTLPHEAKDLRKQLVTVRDILDVFAHNFAHELDLWDDVRDALDKGYTVIGDYKDLFDAHPDAVEALRQNEKPTYSNSEKLKERRKKVLSWKKKYFAPSGIKDQVETLFANIRPLHTETQNNRKFSKFFWGGVSELPSEALAPADNAKKLALAQAQLARVEHPMVLNLNDPSSHAGELLFHDHRKRLRTIVKVCHLANKLTPETCNSSATQNLADLVVKLGEIEDLIITGRHLEEDKKNSKAKDMYKKAIKKFNKLKERYAATDMLEPLDQL